MSRASCGDCCWTTADRWEIEQGAAWVACTRNGSFTHVIAAHSLDDLRTKIAAAEQPAPQREQS